MSKVKKERVTHYFLNSISSQNCSNCFLSFVIYLSSKLSWNRFFIFHMCRIFPSCLFETIRYLNWWIRFNLQQRPLQLYLSINFNLTSSKTQCQYTNNSFSKKKANPSHPVSHPVWLNNKIKHFTIIFLFDNNSTDNNNWYSKTITLSDP